MATVPVTRTWVAGEVVTAAYMNNSVTAPIAWLLAPAVCQVRQIVAQSWATGAFTPVTFTAEDVDSTGMHSTAVNTSRLVSVYPGWYMAMGGWGFPSGAEATRRGGNWKLNGATDVNASATLLRGLANTIDVPARSLLIFLNVGDYVELCAFQDTGGALNSVVTTYNQSSATLYWCSN